MPAIEHLQYCAFLSYAHADMNWARWLHRQLEGFRVDKSLVGRQTSMGPVPAALRPIFRDRDDFSGGSSLTEATIAALDASKALIVLCSAVAATRPAVNEEIRLFRFRHPERTLIPVLIDGTFPDNFPAALRFEIGQDGSITDQPITILGPDLRGSADGRLLGLAKLVAGLTGLGTDEIVHRAERDRRRRLRYWIVGLAGVTSVLAGLTIAAEIERREAVSERRIAEQNFHVAERAAQSLVSDVASGLRDVEGMRLQALRKILGKAEEAYNALVDAAKGDGRLKYQQALMYDQFALTYSAQGDTQSELDAATKSLAIMQLLVKDDPSNLLWRQGLEDSQARVGLARKQRGDLDGALALYQSALQILEELRGKKPDDLHIQSSIASRLMDIGDVQFQQGDLAAALNSYWSALAGYQQLASLQNADIANRQRLAIADGKIGEVLTEQGKLKEALASYEATLKVQEGLIESVPEDALYRRGAGVDHIHIGDVQRRLGDNKLALQHYSAARDVFQRLSKIDPDNAALQRDLSIALERIGLVDDDVGDLDGALASYQARYALAERLAALDPRKVEPRLDLAVADENLGSVLAKQGKLGEGLNHQRQGIELLQQLVKENPSDTRILFHLPLAYRGLGEVQLQQRDADGALASFKAALAADQDLIKLDPRNTRWLSDQDISYNDIAEALLAQGKWQEAIASYQASLAIAQQLSAADSGDLELQFGVAADYWHIAAVNRDHDQKAALSDFHRARDIIARLTQLQPENKKWADDLAWIDDQISALKPCGFGPEARTSAKNGQTGCADGANAK